MFINILSKLIKFEFLNLIKLFNYLKSIKILKIFFNKFIIK